MPCTAEEIALGTRNQALLVCAGYGVSPTYNPRHYGAVGDGVANDTAAWVAMFTAIAAAGGGVVFDAQGGTYSVTLNSLLIPSNTTIIGAGRGKTIIKARALIDGGKLIANSDQTGGNTAIVIRDLTIDGNSALTADFANPAINPETALTTYSGLHLKRVSRLGIENVHVTGVYCAEALLEAGIYLDLCTDGSLRNISATNVKQSALYWVDCDDMVLDTFHAWNCGGSGFTSTRLFRCTFSNLIAYKCGDSVLTSLSFTGISINGPDCTATNIVSSNNTGSGVTIGHDNADVGGRTDRGHRNVISNVVAHNNTLDGITVLGCGNNVTSTLNIDKTGPSLTNCLSRANSRYGFAVRENSQHVRFSNCTAHDHTNANSNGFFVDSLLGFHEFVNCTAYRIQNHGFYIANSPDVKVEGCRAFDNGTGSVTAGFIAFAAARFTIKDSEAFDTRVGGARTQDYGLWLEGTPSMADPRVERCRFSNNALEDFHQAGTITGLLKVEPLQLVSADRGDAAVTLVAGVDDETQRFATALTVSRIVTLSATNVYKGARFRVVRTGLGAGTLDVGGLKTIPAATAATVDVEYSAAGWVLTGYAPHDASGTTAHQLDGALHTVAGLTAGHVLTALTPTTFGFSASAGGNPALTTVEVDLGSAWRCAGKFQIGGLAGLTINKPVYIQQAAGPYTGKGTKADEAEMDQLTLVGIVVSATTIQCYWNSFRKVRKNFKFNYFVGA